MANSTITSEVILLPLIYLLYAVTFYIWFRLLFALVSSAKERIITVAPRQKWLSIVTQLKANYLPERWQKRLALNLAQAGLAMRLNVDAFLALKISSALAGCFLVLVFSLFKGALAASLFLPVIFFFFWLPDIWLRQRAEKRRQQITRSLPDFIDLLTICVEAGLGLDSAIAKIAEEAKGPLAEEMRRLLSEIQFGQSRRQAWHNLAERLQIKEVNSLSLAISQAELFGVSIGKVLRVQAEQLRTQWRQEAEERALKIPTKLVFPLVLCIFPALLLIILGPAAINIYRAFLS